MNQQTKAPALAGVTGLGNTQQANYSTRPPKKWQRVLRALLSGKSYNRFEAERALSDHCLHSTVSGLQRKGLTIHRRYETVPGYMGSPTDVCRYWLAPESLQKARELLRRDNTTPIASGANLGLFDANPGGA